MKKTAYSLGIIGGADGPTAVFVTGSPVVPIVVIGVLVAAAVGLLCWLHHRNR